MTQQAYTKPAQTQARVGNEAEMLAHITSYPVPREYRRGRFFAINRVDDETGFFRDKARRLARWHRQSRQEQES
jgi:hypothetical protein